MVIEDKKLDELIKNKTSDNYNLLDLQTITKLKINFERREEELKKIDMAVINSDGEVEIQKPQK